MYALDTSKNILETAENQNFAGKVLHAQNRFEEKKTLDHHKNSFENLNRLHKLIEPSTNNNSFDSMEGIENSKNLSSNNIFKTIRDKVPIVALGFASTMHLIAGFSKATKILPENIEGFFDKKSLLVSKAANLYNFVIKGISALQHGRSWDGIGRLAYSIAPFASLENFFLFSGLSSGISMIEQGHKDKVKPSKNLFEDFINNAKAFKEKIIDIYKAGLGKNRMIFRGKEFEEKHNGTMFVSAFGNFIGATLGILSPNKGSSLRKAAAIIRNLGGIGCDYGKLVHGDINNKLSGGIYLGVSALDILQTFTAEPFATVLSHLSLATYNLANFFYTNTSSARDEGTYVDKTKKLRATGVKIGNNITALAA